jgi:hypothetical protein
MKCGDKGFKTAAGLPCGQTINPKQPACLWHSRTPEERRLLALRGTAASMMKTMEVVPDSTPAPQLASVDGVVALLQDTIQRTRTGRLDPRRAEAVMQGALRAVQALQIKASLPPEKPGPSGLSIQLYSSFAETTCPECCHRFKPAFEGINEITPTVVTGAPEGDHDLRTRPESATSAPAPPVRAVRRPDDGYPTVNHNQWRAHELARMGPVGPPELAAVPSSGLRRRIRQPEPASVPVSWGWPSAPRQETT